MKQIPFLATVLMMFAASVYAQPAEDVTVTPDSLEVTEEEDASLIPDSLEVTEEEDVSLIPDSLEVTEEEDVSLIPDSLEVTEEEDVSLIPDSLEVMEEIEIPIEDVTPHAVPNDPSSVLQGFFQALKTGDTFMISQLISSDGLDEIDIMLEILQENLDNTTISRLTNAGYTATADEIDDWSPMDYLINTIALPVMKARYSLYEMQIGDYSDHGNELVIPLVFITSSGMELPYQAVLRKEDNQWKVTNFMGLNSFP